MCKFKSAILMKDGTLYHHELITSHEQLIDYFGINDSLVSGFRESFVRIEFVPKNGIMHDIDSYELQLDDEEYNWYEGLKADTIEKLRDIVSKMIITGEKKCIIGGGYILKDAKVDYIANCILYGVYNSYISLLLENSQVGELWGNSQVGILRENSKVGVLRENSKVGELWGNSKVGILRENSQVGILWENSQVGELWGNSKVLKDNR